VYLIIGILFNRAIDIATKVTLFKKIKLSLAVRPCLVCYIAISNLSFIKFCNNWLEVFLFMSGLRIKNE